MAVHHSRLTARYALRFVGILAQIVACCVLVIALARWIAVGGPPGRELRDRGSSQDAGLFGTETPVSAGNVDFGKDAGTELPPVPRPTSGPLARGGIYANHLRQKLEIPAEVAETVGRLVLFVGYPRSCHSLVASLLDAHPHMAIAHEYDLVRRWNEWTPVDQSNRTFVFNMIFNITRTQALYGLRSAVPGTALASARNAYSYGVPNQWNGNYKGFIQLIGDKHGGRTSKYLSQEGSSKVKVDIFQEISNKLKLPLVFVHVMRNPYDNIATMALKQGKAGRRVVNGTVLQGTLETERHLTNMARVYTNRLVKSVEAVRKKYRVVDIKCEDLVRDPVSTLRALCNDLGIYCGNEYLTDCSSIINDKPSRTRYLIKWPVGLKENIAKTLSNYPFLAKAYNI